MSDLTDPQALQASQAERSDLEIKKLKLETEILQKKSKWEPYSPLIPLAASFVTVIALAIGFLQFQRTQNSQHEKADTDLAHERITKFQNQLRSDVDEISRFTHDTNQTLSRLSFLLDDMKTLIDLALIDEQSSQAPKGYVSGYERKVTKALVEQIVNDADFRTSQRDVTFANTISKNWNDYQTYLRDQEHLNTLNDILYRYVRALRYLREKNPAYFKELSYDKDAQRYRVSKSAENGEGEESLFQHIRQLGEGFREHLNLISDDAENKKIIEQKSSDLGDALCNRSIAEHLLNDHFIPRPCMPKLETQSPVK